MQDHGFVSKINKRLGDTECQWPQSCSETSDQNQSLHCDIPLAFPVNYRIESSDSINPSREPISIHEPTDSPCSLNTSRWKRSIDTKVKHELTSVIMSMTQMQLSKPKSGSKINLPKQFETEPTKN